MYKEYFGFIELPFSIAPDPRYLYMSGQHREALAHLLYGVTTEGGFVLLTGEIGTGKTTICRGLLEQIPENTDIAFILNPKVSTGELLATVCDELGIQYPEENHSIKVFVDRINDHLLSTHANGRKTILIIEEAQNLSADVMEQIRLLTNLETSKQKLLQIIMVGQPELKEMLERPGMEQLSQRITARYHLGPLTKKEVNEYINHRLTIAGVSSRLFPDSLTDLIYRLSRGIPRLINVICDRALLGAYVQGKQSVDKKTLLNAAHEVLSGSNMNTYRQLPLRWIGIGVLLVAIVLALVSLFSAPQNRATSLTTSGSSAVPATATKQSEGAFLIWPPEQPAEKSKGMALQSLLSQWNIDSEENNEATLCRTAEEKGLRCLEGKASLETLKNLNRPAVLKLFDEEGREFYAALIGITDQTATFVVGAQKKSLDLAEITKQWLGDYTLLWRPPESYHGDVHPGSQGKKVEWLDRQISLLRGTSGKRELNNIYGEELIREVRTFQIERGLRPDGIVGPLTIIHLANAVGSNEPVLYNREKR
jgi:general secretion pathway protein A